MDQQKNKIPYREKCNPCTRNPLVDHILVRWPIPAWMERADPVVR